MKAHFRFLCLCLAMLGVAAASRAQLSGTLTVPSTSYPTLASVITALNTQGVGAGGVIVNFTAATNETAPVGGYQLGSATLNASTSAIKPIVINGNGNLLTGNVGTGSADGIFYIRGTDYVTINNLNLADPATNTTTTTQMEWGYVLCKLNTSAPYDGCQNDVINGCTINLTKTNSGAYGIYSAHIAAGSTSTLSTASAVDADANSFNKFTGNTINNVTRGIYVIGISTLARYDKANQIGGITPASGNNITVGGASNAAYGIYSQYDSVITIQNNTIAANATQATTVYQIYMSTGAGTMNVLNNVMNVSTTNTSLSMYGLYNSSNIDAGAIHNITGNNITGTTSTTSGTLYGIYEYQANCNTLNINNNSFTNLTWNTSSYIYLIYSYYHQTTPNINVNNNYVYNLTQTNTSGYFYGFYIYEYYGNVGWLKIDNNTFRKITSNGIYCAPMYTYGSYNNASPGYGQKLEANYNTIDSVDMTGVTSSYCYAYNQIAFYGVDSSMCKYNTLSNFKFSTSATNYVYMYNYFGYFYYAPNNSQARGNVVKNVTGNYVYDYNFLGYYAKNVDSNTVMNINLGVGPTTSNNGYVYNYLNYNPQSRSTCTYNLFRDITTLGSGQTFYTFAGAYNTAYDYIGYNSFRNISLAGASYYNYIGYYNQGPVLVDNNVQDSITLGTGSYYGFYPINYYGLPDTFSNNRISNVKVTTGTGNTIYGWYLTGSLGSEVMINNIFSNLTLPSTFSGSNVYAAYAASPIDYKFYHNTFYINPGASSGAGYGATALYYSATANSIELKNNIFNVNMTPGSSGLVAALRRTTGTAGTAPANLLATSDGNIYYAPNVTNAYLYTEGSSSSALVNSYSLTNDPNFNTPCGLFKSFMGHDKGSFTENNLVAAPLPFTYRPTGTSFAESGGVATNSLATANDYAGVARGTLPDIGALEFSGTALDQAPPAISYVPVAKTSYCVSPPTIVATITDQTGVAQTLSTSTTTGNAPRLYYKKSNSATNNSNVFGANNNTTNGWKFVEPSSISGNTYTFNMDYTLLNSTVVPGDSITYFIIAQDITSASNTNASVASFSTCPTSVALGGTNTVLATPASFGFKILNTPTFAINAFPVGLCGSGSVNMTMNINPVGATMQWQQATMTGAFTNITGATSTSYATPVLTTSTRYRVQILCGTSVLTTTGIDTIVVANPVITATTPATRCGWGSVNLGATVAAPATVNWYTTATGGLPIFTGTTFPTPNLGSTTTYYASGVVPHAATEAMTKPVPTSPYSYTYSTGYGIRFTLQNPSTHIYNTTVYPNGAGSFTVDLIDNNTGSSIRTAGPFTVTSGGLSNPTLLNLGWYNVPAGDYQMIMSSYTGSPSLHYEYSYPTFPWPYNSPSGNGSIYKGQLGVNSYLYYYFFFYNTQISANCQSARTAVTATVTPATPIVASSPNYPGVCTGGSATLNATSTNFSYLYNWTWPVGNSAAGNSISVSPTATTKYLVTATDYSTMCVAIDSITISVSARPAAPTLTPTNPTICQGSSVSLTGATPAAPGGTGIVGTGTSSSGTSGYPTPWNEYWTAQHDQYLVLASELTAAGIPAGNLNSLSFYQDAPYSAVTTGGSYAAIDNFKISIGATTATSITSTTFNSAVALVTSPTLPTFTPSTTTTGWVTYVFPNGYNWNGTSNLIIDVQHQNCSSCPTACASAYYNFGGNASCRYSTTSFVSSLYAFDDPPGSCSITTFGTPTLAGGGSILTSTRRPNMMFGYGSLYALNWLNVTGLYKTATLTTAMTLADTNRVAYASPATTTVYTAVTNANGCVSLPSAPDTVFVNPAPLVTVTPAGPQTICAGNSVTLSIPTGANQTYQWSVNGTPITGAVSNTINATTAGIYTVTATNLITNCSATSIQVPVTVNPAPTVSIAAAGPTTFCNGSSVVLNVTTNGAAVQWKLNGAAIPGATASSYTAIASGTYTATVTSTQSCTNTSNAIVVTVNTTPTTITPGGSTTFCTGQSVTLNAPTTGGTYTYQWYNGTTPVGTGSSYTATTSGSYTVVVTNTTTTCVATSAPTVVTAGSSPTANIAPANSAGVCVGSTLNLATNPAPGLVYQWYLNGNPITGATSSTYSKTGATTADAGSYTVTVSTGPGCTTMSPVATVVTVNTLPAASITAAGPTTFCSGVGVTLNANTGTGLTYQWNLNGTPVTTLPNSSSVSVNTSGNYTVTTTNSNGCSNTSNVIAVTANALPNPVATPATSPTFCAGGNVVISVPAASGITYQWYKNGVPVSTGTSITATTTGNYTVTGTNSTGCQGTSQVVSVLVNPLPNVTTVPSSAATICQGNTTTLSVATGAAQTYAWYLGTTQVGTNATYTTGTAGTYTVTVNNTVTGCTATSTPVTLTVSAPPTATAASVGPTTFCAGDSVRINANLGTGLTYQWRYNGNDVVGATGDNYYAKAGGTYTVRVTNAAGCATTSNNVVVTVNPTPPAYITYSTPLSFCEGSAVVLNANAGTGLTYQWMYNGSPMANTSMTNIASTTGTYSVKTTNTFGCSTLSDTLNVLVYPKPVPVITRTRDTLVTSASYVTYQWFFNNAAIAGATSNFIKFNTNGAYRVRVIDANGCEGLSEILFMNNVGISNNPISRSIKVYPNPTNGIIHIDASVKVKASLRDVTGKAVLEGSDVKEMDMGDVANGTYLLYITTMEGQLLKVEKVTKTNN